ncbi:MAG: hypothetical protein MZV64_52905 [Ignavibacteriales bacterium]|nr:hypothetical protein [Ignavibacteriales bacterium]
MTVHAVKASLLWNLRPSLRWDAAGPAVLRIVLSRRRDSSTMRETARPIQPDEQGVRHDSNPAFRRRIAEGRDRRHRRRHNDPVRRTPDGLLRLHGLRKIAPLHRSLSPSPPASLREFAYGGRHHRPEHDPHSPPRRAGHQGGRQCRAGGTDRQRRIRQHGGHRPPPADRRHGPASGDPGDVLLARPRACRSGAGRRSRAVHRIPPAGGLHRPL